MLHMGESGGRTGLDWHGAGCEGVIVLCKFIERRLDWSG
jgi:hypothetical protein